MLIYNVPKEISPDEVYAPL